MSVDTTVSVGVGFTISPDEFAEYRKTVADEENFGDDELLENLLSGNADGLCFGTGGSYYDSKPLTHWIAVRRLTTSHDTDDIPGGVIGLERTVITLPERIALNDVAQKFGIEVPTIGQFMSVLWS